MDIHRRALNLNNIKEISGKCVLYVMSRDQRVSDNYALMYAQSLAIKYKVPLAVVFCLKPKIKNRAREQYEWMINGLEQVEVSLDLLHIPFMMLIGNPVDTLLGLVHHTTPLAIVFDLNPLRGPRNMQQKIASEVDVPVYMVDTHNIVPVWEVSQKQEFAARTIRSKIHRLIPEYVVESPVIIKHPYLWPGTIKKMAQLRAMIDNLLHDIPHNGQTLSFVSGENAAQKTLEIFLKTKLRGYAQNRNDPSLDGQSGLSPYLHFGQISRLKITREVMNCVSNDDTLREDGEAYLEELNIRSALSDNYCFYNENYDSLLGVADWAQKTLHKHAKDPREFVYTMSQFESASTHDPAWNAAQLQLTHTGKMHGYMRMYWAKKVLEWSDTPEDALRTLIRLNDFYSLDGNDPNGYVGILWSIAGLHDRPWFERSVYGTIRYMNYNGLKRKFKIDTYIEQQND